MKTFSLKFVLVLLAMSTIARAQTNPIGPQLTIVPNPNVKICSANSQREVDISNLNASNIQLTIKLEIVDGLNNVMTPTFSCNSSGSGIEPIQITSISAPMCIFTPLSSANGTFVY